MAVDLVQVQEAQREVALETLIDSLKNKNRFLYNKKALSKGPFLFYSFVMNKIFFKINLLLITFCLSFNADAASMRKLQKKLKKSLQIEININNELMRNKEACTRNLLESWSNWWKEVKSPYKEQYIKRLSKLTSLNILRSNSVQTINGEFKSLYLVKKICTGGRLGRTCKTLDSTHLKIKKSVKFQGETPRYELNLENSRGTIFLEYAEDWSAEKRYDTFNRVIFQNVERDNKLFEKYSRYGQIGQLVRPGTDSTLKKYCSFPRLDQILTKLK
jgi:hypothetical protein